MEHVGITVNPALDDGRRSSAETSASLSEGNDDDSGGTDGDDISTPLRPAPFSRMMEALPSHGSVAELPTLSLRAKDASHGDGHRLSTATSRKTSLFGAHNHDDDKAPSSIDGPRGPRTTHFGVPTAAACDDPAATDVPQSVLHTSRESVCDESESARIVRLEGAVHALSVKALAQERALSDSQDQIARLQATVDRLLRMVGDSDGDGGVHTSR
jgi:hypothetical protein